MLAAALHEKRRDGVVLVPGEGESILLLSQPEVESLGRDLPARLRFLLLVVLHNGQDLLCVEFPLKLSYDDDKLGVGWVVS